MTRDHNVFIGSLVLITVVVVALSILPLGCLDDDSPAKAIETIEVTQENNGQTIVVAPSDLIDIELRENPTTGYQWNLTSTDGLTLIDDRYIEDEHEEGMVGVGGTHLWKFEVSELGVQQVDAIYKRPWENVTGNEQTFNLTIDVRLVD